VARVSAQLAIARTRRLLEQQRAEQQALFQQAQTACRAKDELLATLGHELRNPLAAIVAALHLMRLRAPDVLVHEREIIARQVRHTTRLVEDLLDVSRIKSGKVRLERRRVDLAAVVASATEMASPLIEERSHHLDVSVEPGLVVAGDEARLAEVVSNLLTNAAKYTPVGGHIALEATREGGHAVVRVVDDGKGIAAELLPRVFDLFVQGAAGEERTGGLGLGLTIVRSLAVMHGGSVHVESDGPGKGSTFTLRLPLLPSSSAEPGLSTAEWSPEAPGAAH
jgi:signal transduction histidine kinase